MPNLQNPCRSRSQCFRLERNNCRVLQCAGSSGRSGLFGRPGEHAAGDGGPFITAVDRGHDPPLPHDRLAGRDGPVALSATHNWAGYAVESQFGNAKVNNDSVTAVSGSWIVPAVTPPATTPAGKRRSAPVWVGIDGLDNNTVEQVGTDSYVIGSKAYYYAWTEMYPQGMTEIAPIALRVSPATR